MSTIADKLTSLMDTKTQIKEAITRKGGVVTENMPFSNYPSAIDGLNVLPAEPYSAEWQPNSTWWDVEQILKDDVNETYPYKYIMLLSDYSLTTALSKGVAYKTSDGQYYTTASVTHIWDTTKDRDCNEGYKTRWIIVYLSARSLLYQNILSFKNILGCVFKCDMTHNSASSVTNDLNQACFFYMLDTYRYYLSWNSYVSPHTDTSTTNCRRTCEVYFPVSVTTYNNSPSLVSASTGNAYAFSSPPLIVNVPSNFKNKVFQYDPVQTTAYRFTMHIGEQCPYVLIKESEVVTITGTTGTYAYYFTLIADAPTNFFNFCKNITIPIGFNWYQIDLRYCRLLPISTYRHIISNIQDNTGSTAKYFYVNNAVSDRLTTADKLLLASKNWTLSVQNV